MQAWVGGQAHLWRLHQIAELCSYQDEASRLTSCRRAWCRHRCCLSPHPTRHRSPSSSGWKTPIPSALLWTCLASSPRLDYNCALWVGHSALVKSGKAYSVHYGLLSDVARTNWLNPAVDRMSILILLFGANNDWTNTMIEAATSSCALASCLAWNPTGFYGSQHKLKLKSPQMR